MKLRPYQKEGVNNTLRSYHGGARRVCLVSPTGTGKTAMAAEIISRAQRSGRDVLAVAHRQELVDQLSERTTADVISPAKLLSHMELLGFYDFLVIDECHHYAAEEWRRIVNETSYRILGLTATPMRGDGKPLGNYFDELVLAIDYPAAFKEGWLLKPEYLRPKHCLAPDLAMDPVDAVLKHAPDRKGIIYVRDSTEVASMCERLQAEGIRTQGIQASTPTAWRKEIISRFREGDFQYLVNIHVLTEGFDVPGVDCVVVARGVSSDATYLQIVGRALRPSGQTPLVLDLSGISHLYGLLDEPRIYTLKKGIELEKRVQVYECPRCGHAQGEPIRACPKCEWVPDPMVPKPPKVRTEELRQHYQGSATDPAVKHNEFKRLMGVRAARDFSYYWVAKEYKKLFGNPPTDKLNKTLTFKEKRREYQRNREYAESKGYRPGWAKWRFKETFGHWPKG